MLRGEETVLIYLQLWVYSNPRSYRTCLSLPAWLLDEGEGDLSGGRRRCRVSDTTVQAP